MSKHDTSENPKGIFVLPAADTSAISRKWLDLPYASDSPFQKLDVYLPSQGSGPWPTIVYIHGGAWMACDKADIQVTSALSGLERGYPVVSANYRLSGEARFPAQLDDVQLAMSWVRKNASAYRLDPSRLVLWGESAGAHLVSLAGLRNAALIRAVVSWYCPTDFLKMDPYLAEGGYSVPDHARAESPESRLLGARIAEVPDLVRQANPETWITAEAPPFLLQHGTKDSTVPWQLSRDFAERLRLACGSDRVELDLLEGAGHAGPEFRTPQNLSRVFAFIEKRTA